MKSPLCCWRKEMSFNRTITVFLCSFWSLRLFPSIYTISLTLCFVLGARRLLGRQYRQQSEATAGGLLDDQWRRIWKNHHTTVLYLWVMQKRWADGQRGGQCGKIEEISNSCQIKQGTVNITSLQSQAWHSYNMHVTHLYVHVCACMGDKHTEKLMNRLVLKKNCRYSIRHYCKCQHVYFQKIIVNIPLNSHWDLWVQQQLIKAALILGKWAVVIADWNICSVHSRPRATLVCQSWQIVMNQQKFSHLFSCTVHITTVSIVITA